MQIACCQFDIAWEDKPDNYSRVKALVRDARLEPDALLLLPEMFATGFSMDTDQTAEAPGGPTWRFLAELAADHQIYVQAGVVLEAEEGRPRNEAVIFDPMGRLVTRYAKTHLFSYAKEDEHYAPGDGPVTFEWEKCWTTPAVCYDLRFPELFRRAFRDRHVELFTVIANWPVARESHWLALLRARAIENQAYLAAVNRCGEDPTLVYSGRSQIIDPRGEILADAGGDEIVIKAEVDLQAQLEYRLSLPFLGDRRAE